MKLGANIQKGTVWYKFDRFDVPSKKYIYTRQAGAMPTDTAEGQGFSTEPKVGSPEWLRQLQAKVEKTVAENVTRLRSFNEIREQFPQGAITDSAYVGGTLKIDDRNYKMYQPVTLTTEGYVYVPVE